MSAALSVACGDTIARTGEAVVTKKRAKKQPRRGGKPDRKSRAVARWRAEADRAVAATSAGNMTDAEGEERSRKFLEEDKERERAERARESRNGAEGVFLEEMSNARMATSLEARRALTLAAHLRLYAEHVHNTSVTKEERRFASDAIKRTWLAAFGRSDERLVTIEHVDAAVQREVALQQESAGQGASGIRRQVGALWPLVMKASDDALNRLVEVEAKPLGGRGHTSAARADAWRAVLEPMGLILERERATDLVKEARRGARRRRGTTRGVKPGT